jgi:hypothetical protein
MSIKSFNNQATEDIFYGENSKRARKTVEQQAWPVA